MRIKVRFAIAACAGVLMCSVPALGPPGAGGAARAPQIGPCLPTINPDTPEDPRLGSGLSVAVTVVALSGDAAGPDQRADELRFEWTHVPEEAGCLWVARGREGQPDYSSFAEFVLPPTDRSLSIQPTGGPEPSEVCYRFVPISEKGYGPTTVVCAEVSRFRSPQSPQDPGETPGAPSAGTGLISDEGSGAWVVGFLVVTGTIVLVLVVNGRLRRRAE